MVVSLSETILERLLTWTGEGWMLLKNLILGRRQANDMLANTWPTQSTRSFCAL